jgi:hypothetical protein
MYRWKKNSQNNLLGLTGLCVIGSRDFGTLTYFKLIWIAEKILRSNYKVHFSQFSAISCDLFGSKKLLRSHYKIGFSLFLAISFENDLFGSKK